MGFPDTGSQRSWGYYLDRSEAVDALHINATDMWETCYDYAILEEVEEGINPFCAKENRTFFKYDRKKDGYFECEEPVNLERSVNFSLG